MGWDRKNVVENPKTNWSATVPVRRASAGIAACAASAGLLPSSLTVSVPFLVVNVDLAIAHKSVPIPALLALPESDNPRNRSPGL